MPKQTCTLEFPCIGFETDNARVIGWRPYDENIAKGSDIAILIFNDDAPDQNWVALEGRRPAGGTKVVTLEYGSARADGDPRAAEVLDGDGA